MRLLLYSVDVGRSSLLPSMPLVVHFIQRGPHHTGCRRPLRLISSDRVESNEGRHIPAHPLTSWYWLTYPRCAAPFSVTYGGSWPRPIGCSDLGSPSERLVLREPRVP